MEFFTIIGKSDYYPIFLAFLLLWVDAKLAVRAGLFLTLVINITGLFSILFHAPRPFWVTGRINPWAASNGFGLPSGHASASTFWIFIACSVRKKIIWITAVIVSVMICLSRVFLGAHFLSQVIFGLAIGIIIILLFIPLEPKIIESSKKKNMYILTVQAFLSSLCIIIAGMIVEKTVSGWQLPLEYAENIIKAAGDTEYIDRLGTRAIGLSRSAGMLFGILLSVILLYSRAGFSSGGSFLIKSIRLIIGTALIYGGMKTSKLLKSVPDFNLEVLKILIEYLIGFIMMFYSFYIVPRILIFFRLAAPERKNEDRG